MRTARDVGRPVPLAPRRVQVDAAVATVAVLTALLLAVFVVWPMLRLVGLALGVPDAPSLAGFREFFASARRVQILTNSLLVAAVSTALTVTTALVLAYAVTHTTVPGKGVISVISFLPLISPPFLGALGCVLLLGRNGALTRALGWQWSIDGFAGIVVAQLFTFLPQAYLLLTEALGGIDTSLEEAAENLGAGPLTILGRVTLALARPGLASAVLVVFLLSVTDFGNPFLIGGRYHVLPTEIYAQVIGTGHRASVAIMSVILLVPCLAAYGVNAYWVGRPSLVTLRVGARRRGRPTPRALRWALGLVTGGVATAIAGIYALIPLGSVVRRWGSDWSLSLRHYAFAAGGESAGPLSNSLELALAAGVTGTVIALVTGYLIERKRPPGARAIEFVALLPAALPGTVVGVGYLLAFHPVSMSPAGTFALVVASVVFWKFPAALLAGLGTLKQLDPAVEEAAVSLGASPSRTFARIVLPLLTGPAFSIFVYFFVNGLVTVSAVILLASPGFRLGSVAILTRVATGDPGVACALATIMLGLAISAVVLLRALGGRERVAILQT